MKQAKPLSPAHNRIVSMLVEADGSFVRGAALCSGAGIPMALLSNWMRTIREARPDLVIESRHGSGYRAAALAASAPAPTSVASIPGYRGATGPAVPLHRRMAASMAVIDLLPPNTAELVKIVAAESGEAIDETLHRLISYGVEVHNDLVIGGENPVGLRPATESRPVWQ